MLFYLSVFFANALCVNALARNGSFTTQPYSAFPAMGLPTSDYGVGMAYDSSRDRVLLGSLGAEEAGKIVAVPYYNSDGFHSGKRVEYSISDITVVYDGSDSRIPSITGLRMDPSDPDFVWIAAASYPPTPSSACGAARVNLLTGDIDQFYDFSPFRSAYGNFKCMVNDLTFDTDGDIYVTDLYGYQIFKVALVTDFGNISVFSSNTTYLCNKDYGACPPSSEDVFYSNGPNGIEYADSFLLVAVSDGRLVRAGLDGEMQEVSQYPERAIQGCNGLVFDALKQRLFIAGAGIEGSVQFASFSSDWLSLTMHTAYGAGCGEDDATAVALANDADVLVYCSRVSGSVPGNVSVLPDLVSSIAPLMPLAFSYSDLMHFPEGIEFDAASNRVILSSMFSGILIGVPASNTGPTFTPENEYVYYDGTGPAVYANLGLQMMSTSGEKACYMYGAVGDATHATTETGVAFYDICNNEMLFYHDFLSAGVTRPGGSQANDITVFEGAGVTQAFITDSYGQQLWRLINPSSEASVPTVFLKDFCQSPNGVENYKGKYILVGCTDGIYRIDIETGENIRVYDPSGSVEFLDGIFFNGDGNILYCVINGINVGVQFDSVIAVSSSDNWLTLDVLYVFKVGCPGGYSSAAVQGGSTLYVLCAFGVGPYEVHFLQNADDVITNGNNINANLDKEDTNGSSSSSGDDDEDEYILLIAAIVLSSLCLLCLVLFAGYQSKCSTRSARDGGAGDKSVGLSNMA